MQGIYSASKHAVKGFTDALRMELESDGAPISVSLVKPGAIDTPYTEHAKNYMAVEPKNPPPLYAPETVARAILHCAETPERDVFVGAGGKGISASGGQNHGKDNDQATAEQSAGGCQARARIVPLFGRASGTRRLRRTRG
jgi:NAD(P)-dependent dehydrogenase (short-subunit alcohol dehydrogenase family)